MGFSLFGTSKFISGFFLDSVFIAYGDRSPPPECDQTRTVTLMLMAPPVMSVATLCAGQLRG